MPDRIAPDADDPELPADDYNAVAEAIDAARLSAGAGVALTHGRAGRYLAVPGDPCVWATLSGSSSPYSWAQALPQAAGTTVAGSLAGSANAYEVNSTASLSGKVVKVCPGYPGDWRFYYRTRSGGGGGGITIPGCGTCNPWPATLTLTFSAACQAAETIFSGGNDGISYQTVPSGYAALSIANADGKAFLSDHVHTDSFGDHFQWLISCNSGEVDLTRVYVTSVFGSPLKDLIRYSWSLTATGNTCAPIALTNGRVYPGGSATCDGSAGTLIAAGDLPPGRWTPTTTTQPPRPRRPGGPDATRIQA